ncbi:hypothetical protein J2W34_004193 [Variovorax boronicumulans]|nr:hypothetical protein [Variovorax boronicumulans]
MRSTQSSQASFRSSDKRWQVVIFPGIGLLLVLVAVSLTFVDSTGGIDYSWLSMLCGLVGALLLCGGGELAGIFGARLLKGKRMRAHAMGLVESIELGRGIFNGRALVSLVVSFAGEDGMAHRTKTNALVSLATLSTYEKGRPVVVRYDASDPDGGILVEPAN